MMRGLENRVWSNRSAPSRMLKKATGYSDGLPKRIIRLYYFSSITSLM